MIKSFPLPGLGATATAAKSLLALSAAFLLSALPAQSASIFTEVVGLSVAAQNSLVAHYDGRTGVATASGAVTSWTPVDGNGTALAGLVVTSGQTGGAAANLITYDSITTVSFDDTASSGESRFLEGALDNSATTDFTVFWKGHYDAGAPFQTSGTYAYNIGLNDTAHQRDGNSIAAVVELYNGTTYAGDDITAYDGVDTIWSTVVTMNSHIAYADGVDLNVGGSPTYSIAANADIVLSAFSTGAGFDFVGDIQHLVIFETALNDTDRGLIENYLATTAVPEPSRALLALAGFAGMLLHRRRR